MHPDKWKKPCGARLFGKKENADLCIKISVLFWWSITGNIRTENLLDTLQRKSSLYETMEKAQNEKDIATLMEQTAKQIITSGHSEIHNKAHRQHDELQ